jgi:hypothetical protein
MTDYWFKPKTYGYGATPSSWKGWAAVLGFIALTIGVSWLLMAPSRTGDPPSGGAVLVWLVVMLALTSGFWWLSKAKTDGEWKWRWGRKADR